MRMTHPRIQPLEHDQWNEEASALLGPIAERGRVLNIFKTLANHSALARRWMVFANHILGKSTLPDNFENNIVSSDSETTKNEKVMTLLDVVRCPPLRRIAFIMGYVFLAVTTAYYGHCVF